MDQPEPQPPATDTDTDSTVPAAGERRFTPLALVLCALALLAVVGMFAVANPILGLVAAVVAVGVWLVARESRIPPLPPKPAPVEVAAPTGQSSLTLEAPGPRPDDVLFVWRQFRALDPSEQRTPEQFRSQLGGGAPVLLASGVTQRWANDFAEALRRAGAEVRVR